MEQLTGAGVASLVVLGYVLVVQAMAAAILLLGQFIVSQARSLRSLLAPTPKPPPVPPPIPPPAEPLAPHPQKRTYQLGGDLKW